MVLLNGLAPSLRIPCVSAFILLFLGFAFFNPLGLLHHLELPLPTDSTAHAPATNATLGFQKLYAISLPQRTDRQDALTLMSVLSGLDIEIAPGVLGETVMEKTIPKACMACCVRARGVLRFFAQVPNADAQFDCLGSQVTRYGQARLYWQLARTFEPHAEVSKVRITKMVDHSAP